MDPKMIEMNNLRVLNDYLNQTIDALNRQPRFGQTGPTPGFGFSPFAPMSTAPGMGADAMFSPWFGAPAPFFGQPMFGFGPSWTPPSFSPFAQSSFGPSTFGPSTFGPSTFGPGYGTFGFQPWSPMSEVQRQAQLNQALAARQTVLEAMCRACGIPV